MKWIHISDLHLGKRVNEFSMIEDQRHILTDILRIIDEEEVEGVLIAGDVYDKPVPPVEAVRLLDQFLVDLSRRRCSVFLISGNHDSAQRLAFGSRLLKSGLYIAPEYGGRLQPITVEDAWGEIDVYLLPFVKPAHVKAFHPEAEIETYTDALRTALQDVSRQEVRRSVLVCHQFITGGMRSDSEEVSVGGLDNVDSAVFQGFDYVALGHLHRAQNVEEGRIRYCGTPLAYSFSETEEKSVTIVEMKEKGQTEVRTVPLHPLHAMRRIRGAYAEVTARDYAADLDREDYLHVTLTDEEDVPDAMGKLRIFYPNLMKMEYDNRRTRQDREIGGEAVTEERSPMEMFCDLYELQNNAPMSEEQKQASLMLMERIWEDEQ